MSKFIRYSESLGKINGKKWSQIVKLLLIREVKSPRKKNCFSANFALLEGFFLVSVLLSALVKRFFVSRMRDFFGFVLQFLNIHWDPDFPFTYMSMNAKKILTIVINKVKLSEQR